MVWSYRVRRIHPPGILVVLAPLLLMSFLLIDSTRPAFAVPGGLPPIIGIAQGEEQFDCLRALLRDSRSYEGLKESLAFSSIWHIGTDRSQDGRSQEGLRHSFYFGGKERHTTRLSRTSITVTPEPGTVSGYRLSEPSYGFEQKALGGLPAVADEEGLEVLRSVFSDPSLREAVLGAFRARGLDIQTICIEKAEPGARLSFTSPPARGSEEFVMRFTARFHPDSGYSFHND